MTSATKAPHEGSMADVKNGNSAPPPPELAARCDEKKSALPIDRGYAWVIVIACLLINVICLGFQRAYGILFVAFLELFHMPAGVTSLVMAVQSAFTSVSALMTQTVMLSLLSERQTMIVGAVCGSAGIILSYFASTILLLILTQSVLVGIANGMIMGPTMVIVGKYFHRRRSLAMAIAILGGNLGSMLMPLFTEALLVRYGVRGALLILGAFFLHILVFAGLLRPLQQHQPSAGAVRTESPTAAPPAVKTGRYLERVRGDGDRWSLVEGRPHTSRDLLHSTHLCVSTPELSMATRISITDNDNNSDNDDNDEDINDDGTYELQPLKSDETKLKKDTTTTTSSSLLHANNHHHNNNHHNHNHNHHHNHHSHNNNDSSHHSPDDSSAHPKKQKKQKEKNSGCARCLAMFDFSLFRRPAFLLVTVACALAFLPAALFGMYLPAMAADKGVRGHRAALLLTVFGGCGIVSRLGFGYLADLNCMRRAYLMALLMTLTCVAGMFTPLYDDFSTLALFSVTYGLFGIVFFSLMPVVIVDLMGLDSMAKTLGFVQLFQGVVIALSHPIIGHLRDITGSYHASYYFMSGSGLCCAFLLLFTPLVTPPPSPLNMDQEL